MTSDLPSMPPNHLLKHNFNLHPFPMSGKQEPAAILAETSCRVAWALNPKTCNGWQVNAQVHTALRQNIMTAGVKALSFQSYEAQGVANTKHHARSGKGPKPENVHRVANPIRNTQRRL